MCRASSPVDPVGPRPRFLVDAMLGDVARWLRILGEDCVYADPDWPDDRVLASARPEDRVLVTRDVRLVDRARAASLRALLVPQADVEEVLVGVYRSLGLAPDSGRAATRCSLCNGALVQTGPGDAKRRALAMGREPPRPEVQERHERFWSCAVCGQPYWRGTHWENIEAVRERLMGRLGVGT